MYAVNLPLRGLKHSGSRLGAASLETVNEAHALFSWIQGHGGHCELVQIASDSAHGQNLIASSHIKKGQSLIALPRSCQLRAESNEPALQALIDKVPSDLWPARLALPLIAERAKGEQSQLSAYLQSLPAGIPGLPIFFRPEEMKQLQYPPLVQQVSMRCRWLIKFASEELPSASGDIFGTTIVDANLLGWGMGCASSRAFKLGIEQQPSLLPAIDLCNHSFQPNCRLEARQDGTAELIANQDIPAHEALNINYGNLSNALLLQDYGFIVEGNPYDTVDMAVSADQIQVAQVLAGVGIPSEPQAWQKSLLKEIGADQNGLNVALCRSEPMLDWRLIAAVRVLSATDRKQLNTKDLQKLGNLNYSLAPDVERRALRTLAAMFAQLIAAMGSKLEDDKAMIAEQELTANARLAIRFRVELKFFIQAAIALVLNKLKAIQSVS